jgi:hypothetical protein
MTKGTEARLGYVPHFEATAFDGQRVRYGDLWQQRDLVLVAVTREERDAGVQYASALEARGQEFEQAETAMVVTADVVPRLSAPTVLVAVTAIVVDPSLIRLETSVDICVKG